MKQKILHRGKRIDNNQWVEGFYWVDTPYRCFIDEEKDKHFIRKQWNMDWNLTTQEDYRINSETLCVYINLDDQNKKKIFTGDICRLSHDWFFHESELVVIEYHQYGIPSIVQRYVVNHPKHGNYNFDYIKDNELSGYENSFYEIVGNIFDNPELLIINEI
jgi:uncharacterized phage protein (TIGR01671 family)